MTGSDTPAPTIDDTNLRRVVMHHVRAADTPDQVPGHLETLVGKVSKSLSFTESLCEICAISEICVGFGTTRRCPGRSRF